MTTAGKDNDTDGIARAGASHSLSASASAAPVPLSPPQKAALIVRLLLSQDVSPGLDRLTPAQQATLTRAMASLGPINRATLRAVVQEFTGKLDDMAMTAPRDLTGALGLLEPYISPIARDGLRAEAEAGDSADPWSRIAVLPPDRLRPVLLRESAEVCAILLSKLGVAKAAAILADLPGDRAHLIAHAVSLTAGVTPQTVAEIGAYLWGQMQATPQPAFPTSAVDRVGAILNAVRTSLRDGLLDGLAGRDAPFAQDVRRAIFTFHHIPRRIVPTDVPRILRRVDQDQVIVALAAGQQAAPLTVEFLLENMSRRLAEQLRDEAEAYGPVREDEGEAAMAGIVAAIRALEEEGALRLIPQEG